MLTLIVALILPFFVEIGIDKATYNTIGWVLVGLVGLMVFSNLAILIPLKTIELIHTIKNKCCKKKT